MRHIKTLDLTNFQSHKQTRVELDPGINLVVGTSNGGKSAILRAIHWVLHNEPRGDDFVRLGQKECRVAVTFSDGITVTRIRSDKRNAYMVERPDAETEVYEKVGGDIPLPVQAALGHPPVDSRQGPISYADQFRFHFFTDLSPTELPRAVSEVTGLDDMEASATTLSGQWRKAQITARETEQRIKRFEKELMQYAGIEGEEVELTGLAAELRDAESAQEALSSAQVLFAEAHQLETRLDALVSRRAQSSRASGLIAEVAEARAVWTSIRAGREYAVQVQDVNRLLTAATRRSAVAAVVLRHATSPEIAALQAEADVLRKMRALDGEIDGVISSLNRQGERLRNARKARRLAERERDAHVGAMRNWELWCETCDRPIVRVVEKGVHHVEAA